MIKTYYTDSSYLEPILDTIMKNRPDWKKYSDIPPLTILFLESNNIPLITTLNPTIYQLFDSFPITNKRLLYNMFNSYNQDITKKYMLQQYETLNLSHNIFNNTLYILESEDNTISPIIINSYKKYKTYIKKYPNLILTKYINNPLLFHNKICYIKAYYLVFYDNIIKEYRGFLMKKMYIITCDENFILGDYDNPHIYQYSNTNNYKIFPMMTYKRFSYETINILQTRIYKLFYNLLNIINYNCSNNCYSLFEVEIQPTYDFDIILHRINNITYYKSDICDIFNRYLIEAQISIMIDKKYESEDYIEITNKSFYKNKYNKYREEYKKLNYTHSN